MPAFVFGGEQKSVKEKTTKSRSDSATLETFRTKNRVLRKSISGALFSMCGKLYVVYKR